MQRAIVVLVVLVAAPAAAQTGLLTNARTLAANSGALLLTPGQPSTRWVAQDIMVDEFTDERGQTAYLIGRGHRLVLIIGCDGDGRAASVAIGGLGGNVLFTAPRPDVVFASGDIDFRWGGEGIETKAWVNSGLLIATRDVSGFLDRAVGQVRLRARATLVGDATIQDEFDLLEMVVTSSRVRLRDRNHREGRRELVCGR